MDLRPTILIVDDDGQIRKLMQLFLELAGYTVILASDGREAVELFELNRCSIALTITDVSMPGDMGGFDVADFILDADPAMPLLFMSGTVPEADRGYGCLSKPFNYAEVCRRVRDALSATPGRAA